MLCTRAGDKAIRLTVSDGCYLEVYEDSNLISYCRSDGSLLGRYMASGAGLGDGSIVPVEGPRFTAWCANGTTCWSLLMCVVRR